jgi:hypothetical protein
MIYIIGDSHVSVFSGTDKTHDGQRHIQPEFGTCYTLTEGQLLPVINRFEQKIPYFCPIKIGSHTAYNSFNKIPKIERVISEYNIGKQDFIVFCFGEIDIRNHIGFQAQRQNITINQCIENCVDRYLEMILYFKNKGLDIYVYGPPASSVGWSHNLSVDFGNVVLRNEMTLFFTDDLEKKCNNYGISVISIAKEMMNKDGTTIHDYIVDDIHLSQKTMPLLLKKFDKLISETQRNQQTL